MEDGEGKVIRFISDRGLTGVTGERRYGREEYVSLFITLARSLGYTVSYYEEADEDTDIIVFPDWKGCSEAMTEAAERFPEADIVCGQDLCHQVPALVRPDV